MPAGLQIRIRKGSVFTELPDPDPDVKIFLQLLQKCMNKHPQNFFLFHDFFSSKKKSTVQCQRFKIVSSNTKIEEKLKNFKKVF